MGFEIQTPPLVLYILWQLFHDDVSPDQKWRLKVSLVRLYVTFVTNLNYPIFTFSMLYCKSDMGVLVQCLVLPVDLRPSITWPLKPSPNIQVGSQSSTGKKMSPIQTHQNQSKRLVCPAPLKPGPYVGRVWGHPNAPSTSNLTGKTHPKSSPS